jgi:hypothetical protein
MDFVMPRYVSLKGHSTYDETWLTNKIVENPALLGLGDLDVRDRERRQPSAGRLDLRAVQVKETLTLVATQVLDLLPLGTEEEEGGQPVDRANWEGRASPESLLLCDQVVKMIADVEPGMQLSYTKHYIGLSGPMGVRNFVTFYPRKQFVIIHFKIPFNTQTAKQIEDSSLGELSYEQRGKFFRIRLRKSDLDESCEVIKQLIGQARDHFGPG